ncbi:MAG: enoyl-CoA hydratase/isomerase family protein [Rubrivivax sp.]|nr:enoyl-CoA hydratase/isomerase family protein [Rubrivivax sp.]
MIKLPPTTAIEPVFSEGWLTLWFSRPEARNALSAELSSDLCTLLEAVRDEPAVRGITLRGRGGVFCAGGDLKSFKTMASGQAKRDDVMTMSRGAGRMLALLDSMPQVTVALVEGAAMAGGFGLTCCCDVVISEENAAFALTEAMIGLSPAQIAPYILQRLGYATGRRLMLTAARFKGSEALALGLADFVGADAPSLEAIEQRIRKDVLKCAPGAIADTKRLILALPSLSQDQRIEAAADNFTDRFLSEEGREGVASFVEKRAAAWVPRNDQKGAS